jgi:hypothetical protein
MKTIYKSLLFAIMAVVPFLTSCKDDNDSNPTLSLPSSFVLNTPEFSTNNVYDLPAAGSINLTTSQPDYGGWPAAVSYAVQLSLNGAETEEWKELATTFTSTKISIDAATVNATVLDMYRAAHEDADPEGVIPLYIRLRAFLADTGAHFGEVFSNAVSVNVLSYDTPSEVTLPTAIYVCGNSIADAWSTWKPLAPVYGREGRFYTMIYNGGDGFKWGYKPEDWFGYDLINEFDNQVDGLEITAASDGNIVFSQPGWYVLKFVTKIVGNAVNVKLTVSPGKAGIIGNSVGTWDNGGVAMTAPADKSEWTFSDFTANGELRAYITVPDEDWWRTEFTLYKGETIYYRDFDIPSDWASGASEKAIPPKEDPENYSMTVGPGKTLKLNFDRNTGSIE